MVIILTGAVADGNVSLGRALAADLGWSFIDGEDRRPALPTFHASIARALDRREHTVIAISLLRRQDRAILRGALHPVRFVLLRSEPLDAQPAGDMLIVHAGCPQSRLIAAIRAEFGV